MPPVHFIGEIPVYGRVSLAPMDGVSDQPFRLLCKNMGSAVTISEFINAADVPRGLNDFSRRASFTNYERPFGYQIYGADIDKILNAARLLEARQPDFIDLNLGCSVRRIAGRGAGAGLLKNTKKVRKILQGLQNTLSIPYTVKIRLGWDADSINYREIANIAEGEGAGMIAIHARRRDQSYREKASWDAISEIKSSVKIPVLGNGDIFYKSDINRMLIETGCDGVMVARAAMGNPWIFSEINKDNLNQKEIFKTIRQHWLLMQTFYPHGDANQKFKKHLKAYLDCPQFSRIDLHALMRNNNPMRELLQNFR